MSLRHLTILVLTLGAVLAAPSSEAEEARDVRIDELAALEARAYVLAEHHQALENRYTTEHPEPQRVGRELEKLRQAASSVAVSLSPAAREEAARRARGIVTVLIEERIGELDARIHTLRQRYADDNPRLADLVARRKLARIEVVRLRQQGVAAPPPLPPAAEGAASGDGGGPPLEDLESELGRLRLRYTDRHPRVRELKERIAAAKAATPRAGGPEADAPDPRLLHLEQAERHLRDAGFASLADLVAQGRRELEARGGSSALEGAAGLADRNRRLELRVLDLEAQLDASADD